MLYLLPPWILATIPSLVQGIGSLFSAKQARSWSLKDIAAQNAYNSPSAQLSRLREAGLPFASYAQGQTGNQSALPSHESGIGNAASAAAGGISNFISFKTQLQQLEILKAETKVKESEALKNKAEVTYLLEGAGEDRQGTNLTATLRAQQGLAQATEKGAQLGNIVTGAAAKYAEQKEQANLNQTLINNDKLVEEISSIITDRELTGQRLKTEEQETAIKTLLAEYQRDMSDAQLAQLLKNNRLIDANISGKRIENDIQAIKYKIEKATETAQVYKTENEAVISGLHSDSVREQFESYTRYQEFVRLVQDELKKPIWERTIKGNFDALVAWAYTSVTGITGQSQGLTNILQTIK